MLYKCERQMGDGRCGCVWIRLISIDESERHERENIEIYIRLYLALELFDCEHFVQELLYLVIVNFMRKTKVVPI